MCAESALLTGDRPGPLLYRENHPVLSDATLLIGDTQYCGSPLHTAGAAADSACSLLILGFEGSRPVWPERDALAAMERYLKSPSINTLPASVTSVDVAAVDATKVGIFSPPKLVPCS